MADKRHFYSPLHPAALFMIQRRQRELRAILSKRFQGGVEQLRLLEIGCGNGQWLAEFQTFGFIPRHLCGVEIDPTRVETAKKRLPTADIRHGDAGKLPWADDSFDIVFQSTVFTSVLEPAKKAQMAAEMRRVCKKDGKSLVIWYDFFHDNPRNPAVKGVGRREIGELFAPWVCTCRAVTLAPPIARRLIGFSWTLCEALETAMPFLRTHLIAEIFPPGR